MFLSENIAARINGCRSVSRIKDDYYHIKQWCRKTEKDNRLGHAVFPEDGKKRGNVSILYSEAENGMHIGYSDTEQDAPISFLKRH